MEEYRKIRNMVISVIILTGSIILVNKARKTDLKMEFIYVRGGCYEMGCGSWAGNCLVDEKPVHEVCVDDFEIGKYEVTERQWQAVNFFSSFVSNKKNPVVQVSWHDVQKYLKKLTQKTGKNYRLPTEAEWEYAARSRGKKQIYAGGDDLYKFAVVEKDDHTYISPKSNPVGTRQANGLGIYDMSGNVSEWCLDFYSKDYYTDSPKNNPQGPSTGSERIHRGGSWLPRNKPWLLRAANREKEEPGNCSVRIGFRLVFPQGQ